MSVDSAWELWLSSFFACLKSSVPCCTVRKSNFYPWISAEIVKEIKKRDRLFRKCNSQPSVDRWEKYRKMRNRVKKLIHNSYRKFIWNLGGNIKNLWKFVRSCLGSSRPKSFIVDNVSTSDPKIIADAFSSHFRLNFSPPSQLCSDLLPPPLPGSALSSLVVSVDEVRCALARIKIDATCGPDGIQSIILHTCAAALAPSLCAFSISPCALVLHPHLGNSRLLYLFTNLAPQMI